MAESDPFKWRHYQDELILLCVRWYLRNSLSYRDLEEMMRERGLFNTARRTISGYETMNIIRKRQIEGVGKGDIRGQVRFVSILFSIAL